MIKNKKILKSLIMGSLVLGLISPGNSQENQKNNLETRINQQENIFYSNKLEEYNSWIKQTYEHANEKNNSAIIVDKSGYILYFLKEGKIKERFNIELGFSPQGNKRIEGDGKTPEGIYNILEKRNIGQTNFYKGFLLDYPNKEDWKNFKELKEKKEISPSDTIGSYILIHGKGTGKKGNAGGRNWTLGCVALSNSDMDRLFEITDKKTKVCIVGYQNIIE